MDLLEIKQQIMVNLKQVVLEVIQHYQDLLLEQYLHLLLVVEQVVRMEVFKVH